MYETHYYTIHKTCPCRIGEDAVKKAKEIYDNSSCLAIFAAEMEKQRVIGRYISYDEKQNTIFIHKKYACESCSGCSEKKTLFSERCHCDHYNHSTQFLPKFYCKCGAEFYRPMFAPLFGANVLISPYKTVLSGDDECIIAIKIDEREI